MDAPHIQDEHSGMIGQEFVLGLDVLTVWHKDGVKPNDGGVKFRFRFLHAEAGRLP